ncbi:MAG: YraN family protein [Gammaproteobacteria bacterium]|nr:YraN family protein [Gammaproteobacteria bacterium]
MTITSKELGKQAEDFAAKLLMAKGLTLLEQNVNFRVGEIDLIMQDQKTLVFVEVRRRKHQQFGGAIGSITASKKKKLTRAALLYLQKNKLMDKVPCRFDLVAITDQNSQLQGQWIKNIF